MRVTLLALGLATAVLSGCNTTPTKPEPLSTVTSADIQSVQSLDELVALRAPLAAALNGKAEADYSADFATLAQMDAQIVELKIAELTTLLDTRRLESGVVPLNQLEALRDDLAANPLLPEVQWQPVLAFVTAEGVKTGQRIAELEAEVETETNPQVQVTLFDELHQTTGYASWQSKRDELIAALLANIRNAAQSDSYDDSLLDKVELIKQIHGDDAALLDEMITVDAQVYAKLYFDALAAGEPDQAHALLKQMSGTEDFPAIQDKLAPTSQKMADYFTALAEESVKDPENLAQSYRWYKQAADVHSILGLTNPESPGYAALSDQLFARYQSLSKADEHAAALSHLYAIRAFTPRRPGLRKALSEQETRVRDLSVKRLSTTDFQSSYKDQDYGDVISSFITQYLFEHVPHDVRIVEREQYEAILRERDLSGDTSTLSSVNLLVSGSVLESKVDSSEARNKKMQRVEVGSETIPNPSYIAWLEMSNKDRKSVEKPMETLIVPEYENISIGVTRHRKVGIFSVSYRLVEASTGRVIFPDSVTVSSEFEDESSEGVEMGDFVMPFKLADLPSDVEILDDLAKKVASEIGKNLVSQLQDQDLKYLAQAERFADQNDCVGEVSALGSALMIMNLKERDTTEVAERFQNDGIACMN